MQRIKLCELKSTRDLSLDKGIHLLDIQCMFLKAFTISFVKKLYSLLSLLSNMVFINLDLISLFQLLLEYKEREMFKKCKNSSYFKERLNKQIRNKVFVNNGFILWSHFLVCDKNHLQKLDKGFFFNRKLVQYQSICIQFLVNVNEIKIIFIQYQFIY